MNEETIEIPLVKATYEELQEVICELQVERYIKDKEIERLNNIINELEKDMNQKIEEDRLNIISNSHWLYVLDKLKELKEGK